MESRLDHESGSRIAAGEALTIPQLSLSVNLKSNYTAIPSYAPRTSSLSLESRDREMYTQLRQPCVFCRGMERGGRNSSLSNDLIVEGE